MSVPSFENNEEIFKARVICRVRTTIDKNLVLGENCKSAFDVLSYKHKSNFKWG